MAGSRGAQALPPPRIGQENELEKRKQEKITHISIFHETKVFTMK